MKFIQSSTISIDNKSTFIKALTLKVYKMYGDICFQCYKKHPCKKVFSFLYNYWVAKDCPLRSQCCLSNANQKWNSIVVVFIRKFVKTYE